MHALVLAKYLITYLNTIPFGLSYKQKRKDYVFKDVCLSIQRPMEP
jgi:hypothetical protein